MLLAGAATAGALPLAAPPAPGADALKARHAALAAPLARNDFQRALFIESFQSRDALRGEVFAVLDHPFAAVADALGTPSHWCDVLILPFNTKYCSVSQGAGGPRLALRIGRKAEQPVKDAYPLELDWRLAASGSDYFEARLTAGSGPMGTRDYRIAVEAVPIDARRTFLHLSYAYAYGLTGRLAMEAYLATAGAGKAGFTVLGRDAQGAPVYIDGMRGVVERNAMRYYLAIDAYIDSLAAPAPAQVEQRIQHWFTATERHPRQLREMDRPTYVALKRVEYARQQSPLK